jgi:S-DNA-T family DNA segregation ATPase FtsK/SpoIIIE
MEKRYSLFADLGVRDIDGYTKFLNRMIEEDKDPMDNAAGIPLVRLPLIVIVIDELADLMMVARADIEDMICRLAQMARAVGIHLLLATQRPSVDVITGLIKANFPSRIAFQVSSRIDSRTILDNMGAEALLGRGDMLFAPGGTPKPIRLQGSYVANDEINAICDFIRNQRAPEYQVPSFDAGGEEGAASSDEDRDVLYDEAIKIIKKTKQASASLLQTHLGIGYPRARKIIEQMERDGIVGPMRGSKAREILTVDDEL